METFIANLKYAIRNRETVTIGGGQFSSAELRVVADVLEKSVAKPEISTEEIKNWKSKPVCCPYCSSKNIHESAEWEASSQEEKDNTCKQIEYQCQGACEGRSFWV